MYRATLDWVKTVEEEVTKYNIISNVLELTVEVQGE
jgi:hypothetical protein